MLSRIGRFSSRARSSASEPQGYQSTGLLACCRRYGLVSLARRFGIGSLVPVHVVCPDPRKRRALARRAGSRHGRGTRIHPSRSLMTTVPRDLDAYLTEHDGRIHTELFEFLRIPSVSARSEHNADTARAAEWVATSLRNAGLSASVHATAGHPIVLGEWRKAPAGAPTVLIYGHYDVQPAEPLDLWTSPPFEPTVRSGRIYARGSVDDKGQLFLHVKALEAQLKTRGKLPVNVVLMAEGEEEVGSDNLEEFVIANKDLLACDAVVISDSAMFSPGQPSILSSLRGLAYFEINVRGPSMDLHSGGYGGA